jgi:hypothetical protein
VVASEYEGFVDVSADTVKFLISLLGVELFLGNEVRLRVAELFEQLVVDVITSFVYTSAAMSLVALADNGFEFSDGFHLLK